MLKNKVRQEQLVLKHLADVGSISGREAEDLYRIRDLPKRVSVLRREGWAIEVALKNDANGQRYARYSVNADEAGFINAMLRTTSLAA